MPLSPRLCACLGQFALASAAWAQFADAPFKVVPFDPARTVVESVGVNSWLSQNFGRIDERHIQPVREHVHALVDARVKELFAKHRSLRPPEPDPVLAMLYAWASRLGLYGASQVYAAVKGSYPVEPPPGPTLPSGIDIALRGNSLEVSSTDFGWQFAVPYHFFPFVVRDEVAAGGGRTQAVAISMGTAADVAPPGYSQATVLVVHAQGGSLSSFERDWAQRLQLPPESRASPIETTSHSSRVTFDAATRLHTEFVFVPAPSGAYAIVYSGLDGTYQANRPHFLDVLRSGRWR